ncbi:MAG TPA: outer membrane protein assembly factor BamA [Prolixibacteraceae bacterium]|mgnify:CR=1 FL=1|nr:outer membrane protein assembly factor BamA [Prolixibacteraceae bacterium]HPS12991.1 outer membrane protein assembly factor BamA [Prolixibacteraceae bacterium]
MAKKIWLTAFLVLIIFNLWSQTPDSTSFSIYYSSPKQYTIGGIDIIGIKYLDTDMLKEYSGLKIGDEITVPGDQVTQIIKKYWKQGLFSDVKVNASKIVDDKIYLEIFLKERPRLSSVNYHGVKKSELDDLKEKVLLLEGGQVVDAQLVSAERIITNYFKEKGFLNTDVHIVQRDDPGKENAVLLDINVDKKEKVKIQKITFHGPSKVKVETLERAMKKTHDKQIKNFLRSKKFQEDLYDKDKTALLEKYNELGYRDAIITRDSISKNISDNTVNIDIWVEEGDKYYIRNIKWIGNTIYPSPLLDARLGISKGEIYNQKHLDKRLTSDNDAVSNLYLDNGYLFYSVNPIETNTQNDSIDLEMRIFEGKQATIDRIIIQGNTKTHEQVARRELYTLPGDLFSKSLLMRSYRQLAQLGHFDQEKIGIDPVPNQENGTVDIKYSLIERANDQVELSGGWGQGMFVGSIGLKFSNFSVQNMFNKKAWRPLPSGDGQTVSLRAQTNGKYYQQYSLSFMDPWFGGKKPNSFSFSLYYSKLTRSDASYNYYNPYNYGGYSSYGYNSYGYGGYTDYSNAKVTAYQITYGASIGYGYRLNWPDDYFTLYHELSLQHYKLLSWPYYFLSTGDINDFSIKTVLSRNSIDNPLYSRKGSSFSLSLELTPPYSQFNGKDYGNKDMSDKQRYSYLEYHKWLFNAKWFTPLESSEKLILHTKYEFGLLGYFDVNRKSPLEGFKMGGDGMSGYDIYGSDNIGQRGYANGSMTATSAGASAANIYTKATVEVRYPITLSESANIYALGFLEAGNSWYDFKTFNVFDMKRAAGLGVRFWLPMFGLLGIDWGYGFDMPNDGNSSSAKSQFHFVIGQQF